jgi:hypothetical protein
MPHTKSSALLKSASNNLDIIECKRQLQHPFVNPIKKEYYRGKLLALEGGTKKSDVARRKESAMKLIQSTDIFERAKACGMLFDDPVFGSNDMVEFSNYTLKIT